MPYNGHRWGGRQNNNFCCNACRDLDYMPICAAKEMQKMTAHIHFLQNQVDTLENTLERKNNEIWRLRSGWVSPSAHTQALATIRNLQSQEIKKLKSEVEDTRKTLQSVLDESPYKEELDEIKSCKICMENFDDKENAPVKLDCPHIFCKKCVKKIQEQRWAKFDIHQLWILYLLG